MNITPADFPSKQFFTPLPPRKIWRWVFLALGVLILLAAAAAYVIILQGKTAWGKQLQDQAWQHFVDTAGIQSTDGSYALTYTDAGTFQFTPSQFLTVFEPGLDPAEAAEMDKYAFTLDGLQLALSAELYQNLSDLKNPKIDTTATSSLTNNGKTYTAVTNLKAADQSGFVKYDYNDTIQNLELLKEWGSAGLDNHKGKWVKFATPQNTGDIEDIGKAVSLKDDTHDYREILRNNRLFSIKSFKGFAFINGQPVVHYRLELDKNAMRRIMQQFTDESMGSEPSGYEKELKDFLNQVNDIILEKLQVSDYEVWVGLQDKQVYKSVILSNAISVTKTADLIYKKLVDTSAGVGSIIESSQRKARDAKRLADIRQMASALELYFNEHNSYPEASNGQPIGLASILPVLPTSPTPAEGPCDDYHNTYWYEAPGAAPHQTYSYSFCLSADTGGVPAGNRKMTESGIDGGGQDQPVYETNESGDDFVKKIETAVLDALREIPWDAQLKVEMSVNNYGIDKKIDLPTDFIDPNEHPIIDDSGFLPK